MLHFCSFRFKGNFLRSQTWSLSCLRPDPSEALFCLDLHEHPLLWCSGFPNCHTCDADCDHRRIWEERRERLLRTQNTSKNTPKNTPFHVIKVKEVSK